VQQGHVSFKRKRLIPFRSSMKKRAKKAKAGISNPANEDFNIKDTPEQSVAALRHERQWGAASDFINGKISEEEFQQCVQQLIAAKCDKGSHIGASNVVQQAAKTPTTSTLPVNPTEDSNMPGRRRSHCFGKGEAKDNMGSIMGASIMEHQPANTPATSNFPVHPTEDCNVSGRRRSQNFFANKRRLRRQRQ
jgi:hypothetical protein